MQLLSSPHNPNHHHPKTSTFSAFARMNPSTRAGASATTLATFVLATASSSPLSSLPPWSPLHCRRRRPGRHHRNRPHHCRPRHCPALTAVLLLRPGHLTAVSAALVTTTTTDTKQQIPWPASCLPHPPAPPAPPPSIPPSHARWRRRPPRPSPHGAVVVDAGITLSNCPPGRFSPSSSLPPPILYVPPPTHTHTQHTGAHEAGQDASLLPPAPPTKRRRVRLSKGAPPPSTPHTAFRLLPDSHLLKRYLHTCHTRLPH